MPNNTDETAGTTSQLDNHFRSLTPFRLLRGIIVAPLLVLSAFVYMTLLAPLVVLLVRPCNLSLYRKICAFFSGKWLSQVAWLCEEVNGTKLIVSGDLIPKESRVLLICNHRTEVDWIYLWNYALRQDQLGHLKYALKSSLRHLPLLGWALHVSEFLFLDRKWEQDEVAISSLLSTCQDRRDGLWLSIFPEGTDFAERKLPRSHAYSLAHGLPPLHNVLVPHTKGFCASLKALRTSLDAVYSVTIAYNNVTPTLAMNLFGTDPAEVHLNVKRYTVDQIPEDESGAATWLHTQFQDKEKLLNRFAVERRFPNPQMFPRIGFFSGLLTLTLFGGSSVYVMWYAVFRATWLLAHIGACATFLMGITYFKWLPLPIFEILNGMLRERSDGQGLKSD